MLIISGSVLGAAYILRISTVPFAYGGAVILAGRTERITQMIFHHSLHSSKSKEEMDRQHTYLITRQLGQQEMDVLYDVLISPNNFRIASRKVLPQGIANMTGGVIIEDKVQGPVAYFGTSQVIKNVSTSIEYAIANHYFFQGESSKVVAIQISTLQVLTSKDRLESSSYSALYNPESDNHLLFGTQKYASSILLHFL